jgi:hypothetical protein
MGVLGLGLTLVHMYCDVACQGRGLGLLTKDYDMKMRNVPQMLEFHNVPQHVGKTLNFEMFHHTWKIVRCVDKC